eukprot:2783788-Pyramimonas_sp.AAC.1
MGDALFWVLEGKSLPCECNALRGAFLAKGDEADGDLAVLRRPSQTRPLGLKSADIHILMSVCCRAVSMGPPEVARGRQGGF